MSLAPHRERIEAARPAQKATLAQLEAEAPDDPLLALSYWTAIADKAQEHLAEAAIAARRSGLSWGVVALGYDRTPATTQQRFGKLI